MIQVTMHDGEVIECDHAEPEWEDNGMVMLACHDDDGSAQNVDFSEVKKIEAYPHEHLPD